MRRKTRLPRSLLNPRALSAYFLIFTILVQLTTAFSAQVRSQSASLADPNRPQPSTRPTNTSPFGLYEVRYERSRKSFDPLGAERSYKPSTAVPWSCSNPTKAVPPAGSSRPFTAPGDLDPTFGVGGRVIDTPFFYDVAIQPDGKIVAVGSSDTQLPVVARYNGDGSPDTNFGTAGKVLIPYNFNNKGFSAVDVAIQPDGKIVGALRDNNGGPANGAVFRLDPNGSMDASFGTNGIIKGLLHPSIGATLPGGKLLITLLAHNFRYNADGSYDASYADCYPFAGGVTGSSHPIMNRVESVILPDGRSMTAFIAIIAGRHDFGLFRCNQDGGLDTTFGSGGVVTTPMGPPQVQYNAAQSIALQADGKFVVAGRSGVLGGGPWGLTVVRYNPDGSLDTGFGTGGIVATSLAVIDPSYFGLLSVAVQSNGKIVANATTPDFEAAVVRFNPNGSIDTTFGRRDGIAIIDFNNGNGGQDYFEAMAVDSQGRAVVVGVTYIGSVINSVLARLLLDPIASEVTLTGRIVTASGRGVDRARITLSDGGVFTRYAQTNPFGYYRFVNVATGRSYTVSVSSKSFSFSPSSRNIFVFDGSENIDFTATPR